MLGLLAALALTLVAFGVDPVSGLAYIWDGAFGDRFGVARTLVKMTPLLLTGLGMVVAWRAGMFNIGGEGQYVIGGLLGAWFARMANELPAAIQGYGSIVFAAFGGAAWAWLAGLLWAKRGVNVVISTILLNFVALQALSWAVRGPLQEREGRLPQTDRLPNEAMLVRFDPQTDLHGGVFLALLAVALVWVGLYLTRPGFRLRVVGANREAARSNRIPVGRVQMSAMAVSGGLCGLAAGIDFAGLTGRVGSGFSQGWGFLGIPVALLGGLHPVGALGSSMYFGALLAGSENLSRYSEIGPTIVYVVQGAAVLAYIGLASWLRGRTIREAPDD